MILQSNRLILRELTPADAQHFYDLNTDPEVIRYTGDVPFEDVDAARQFLENYDQYRKYGYGRWAVIHKESGEWLGWCGLKYSEELAETDLGFRLFRKYWGQGYATEATKACINYGFNQLGLKKIVGRAMKDNVASIRVLEKVGMQFVVEMKFAEHPGLLYVITNL